MRLAISDPLRFHCKRLRPFANVLSQAEGLPIPANPGERPLNFFDSAASKNVNGRDKPGHHEQSYRSSRQRSPPQFFVLSTSAPFLIQGIMSRSLAPTSSMGWAASLARVALNEVWLTLFSSIQSRAN